VVGAQKDVSVMSEAVKDIPRYLRDMADGPEITAQIDVNVLIKAARVLESQSALITELVGALEGLTRKVEDLLVLVDEENMNRSIEELHAEGEIPEELTAAFAVLLKAKDQTNDR
tara:strand:+ start:149 stop:493 length:345 start_codon:yes stop_codon:yes gene_type:complete